MCSLAHLECEGEPVCTFRIEFVERAAVIRAMWKANGNKTAAARLLNVSPNTIYNKLRQYEIIDCEWGGPT